MTDQKPQRQDTVLYGPAELYEYDYETQDEPPRGTFGVTITHLYRHVRRPGDDPPVQQGEGWAVSLPHQCDSWDIAGVDTYSSMYTREEAAAEMEKFIAEAQVALEVLRTAPSPPLREKDAVDDWSMR